MVVTPLERKNLFRYDVGHLPQAPNNQLRGLHHRCAYLLKMKLGRLVSDDLLQLLPLPGFVGKQISHPRVGLVE